MAAGSADQLEEARERFSVFFDEVMERGIDLERVKTALTILALREWRKTRAESVAALRAGLDRIGSRGQQTLRQRNLATLLERQGEIVQRGMQSIQRLILPELDMLAKNELRWIEDTWSRYVPKFSLDRYDARTVTRIVRADAFGGNAGPKTIGEWFKGISDETRRAIEARVKAGILRGDAMSTIVDAVRASKGGALTAAGHKVETLVHSAVQAVQSGIRRDVAMENRTSITQEVWTAALDSAVCVACASLDGKKWPVGQGPYPIVHPKCVPGDTLVLPVGDVRATSSRVFEGDLIVIRTASGRDLSCTPNHPVLTDRGWVAAGLVHEGDNVVCDLRSDLAEESVADANGQNVPTAIHDVAEAFGRSLGVSSREVETSAPDFHGDGMDGQVATIATHWGLAASDDPALSEEVVQGLLVGAGLPVGDAGSCLGDPLDSPALLNSPNLDAVRAKDSIDRLTACAASLGDLEDRLSAVVGVDDLLLGELVEVAVLKDAELLEPVIDSVLGRTEFVSQSGDRFSVPVELDEVVFVDRRAFHGEVFNIECGGEVYAANGILTHNCRCVRVPLVAGFDLAATERASREGPIRGDATAEDWLRQRSAEEQNRILGKRRAQLFREGKLDGLDPRVLLDSNYRPLPVRDLEAKLRERNLRSNG